MSVDYEPGRAAVVRLTAEIHYYLDHCQHGDETEQWLVSWLAVHGDEGTPGMGMERGYIVVVQNEVGQPIAVDCIMHDQEGSVFPRWADAQTHAVWYNSHHNGKHHAVVLPIGGE